MVAVLHVVPTETDPTRIVARYHDRIAPGSHLVVSHASQEGQPDQAGPHAALYRRTGTPMTMRSRAQILTLFNGFELVDPGLVFMPLWRPEDPVAAADRPARFPAYAGVGRR
jgi:hypothetical protein